MNYLITYLYLAIPISIITTFMGFTVGLIYFINFNQNNNLTFNKKIQLILNIGLFTITGFVLGILYPFMVLYTYYIYILYYITE